MIGKLIGGAMGWLVAGLPGLALGAVAGHFFDKGLAHTLGMGSPEALARARQTFFDTSFQLMGQVAKADGRVSEQEVTQAEALMRQLGIAGEQRDAAIACFKEGADAGFDTSAAIARFRADCAGPRQVSHTLLVFLVAMAMADGVMADSERQLLAEIATLLGYTAAEFEQLLGMVEAQSHFHDYAAGTGPAPADALADAYRALGVSADCSDAELKRAYRKLMSEHHPDKLAAKGIPDSMMKVATEKAQEIQAAYELAKNSRKS